MLNRRSILLYFLLVFGLSIPFWVIEEITHYELIPSLPVGVLMTFCPLMVALIFLVKDKNSEGINKLLKRSFDFRRISPRIWYAPVTLLMPAVALLTYTFMRWMEISVSDPQFSILKALGLFAIFFIGALGEELGWTGFILEPMLARWKTLHSSLILGIVWSGWHIIPYIQMNRSAEWIAWFCLLTISIRIIMVWFYVNIGQSVFAAAVFHAMLNLSWFLFPEGGLLDQPRMTGLIVTALAVFLTLYGSSFTLRRDYLNQDGFKFTPK